MSLRLSLRVYKKHAEKPVDFQASILTSLAWPRTGMRFSKSQMWSLYYLSDNWCSILQVSTKFANYKIAKAIAAQVFQSAFWFSYIHAHLLQKIDIRRLEFRCAICSVFTCGTGCSLLTGLLWISLFHQSKSVTAKLLTSQIGSTRQHNNTHFTNHTVSLSSDPTLCRQTNNTTVLAVFHSDCDNGQVFRRILYREND